LEDEVLVETADGTRVKVVTATGEAFPEGREVALDFSGRDVHLFSSESRMTLCHGIAD
jgi:hypothetical protein